MGPKDPQTPLNARIGNFHALVQGGSTLAEDNFCRHAVIMPSGELVTKSARLRGVDTGSMDAATGMRRSGGNLNGLHKEEMVNQRSLSYSRYALVDGGLRRAR
jgi:hypothetical protein